MEESKGMARQRIFWLGMHKILVQTELPRLRKLGYEVFNPPYLSSIQDQSACLNWDANQPTTLPADVFKKLANYNFFYNSISREIAHILNTYFDAVVVTISSAWLIEILKCYRGKVIYRVYGQHYILSQELANHKFIHNIISRDNFWFVPHAAEAVKEEDSWLRERELIAPYCLPDDVFKLTDTWANLTPKWPKIALTCPNIKNPYFYAHYKFLQANFSESYYRYYGVQLSQIDDPHVVGTLERDELLFSLQKSVGYLYSYSEERVCYLPPIEMMILGGPVIYLKGSLLERYFNYNSPGLCVSIDDARVKSKWLLKEDKTFIDEVIFSQAEVRKRYTPDFVWPIFDKTFQDILTQKNNAPSWLVVEEKKAVQPTKRIYIFHHFPGGLIVAKNGIYTAYDGIPRVVRQIMMILDSMPDVEVCITSYADQVAALNGFFRNNINSDRVRIVCINPSEAIYSQAKDASLLRQILRLCKITIKSIGKKILSSRYRTKIRAIIAKWTYYLKHMLGQVNASLKIEPWHINLINNDENCQAVFIPHYYFFPDALALRKKIILYLPDYMPHFFHDTGEFVAYEGTHTTIGRKLAQKADKVFCNSNFTKSYLPDCRLKVAQEKVHVSYLPLLNSATVRENEQVLNLDDRVYLKPYIFYPTRPHPNKNLAFLLRVFEGLVEEGHDINLVLTTILDYDRKAMKVLHSMKHKNRIIFLDTVTDDILTHLYKRAAVLCFTSLAEGNFPPQIHEALQYDTPIVAGRLGFITERVPEYLMDSIIFCEPNNEAEFITGCTLALKDRESILIKQRRLLKVIEAEDVNSRFRNKVLEIFNLG